MSTKSAGLAGKSGYTNLKVMLKGAPGWKKSGKNMVADSEFVRTGNIVLIDLRSRTESADGHIFGSVNIPLAGLEDADEGFPSSKAAPIVLYGNDNDAEKGAKIIKGWGYKSVALLDNGLAGWTAAGNELTKGPAASEIKWVRKLEKGEVSIADFHKVALYGAPDKVILDVRNDDETAGGMYQGAIHIPLDQLEARVGEFTDGRELLIHCTTGARAEMAYDILKKAQLKSRYLVANVECENGSCEISE